jgi:hypothetical protein
MAHRRLRFTWTLTFEGDKLMASEVLPDVERVMAFWTSHPAHPGKFVDLSISGVNLGIMQVEMTVIGHDQWWCSRRADWISRALQSAARVRSVETSRPVRATLPPHEHRGARRFEAPKYQETVNG